MAGRADEWSRVLGGLVVVSAVMVGFLFLAGLAARSYWALALPVAAALFFVLGLVSWIGWTIATVHTPAAGEPLPPAASPEPPPASADVPGNGAEEADAPSR
jgi:hypothetical protein